MTNPTIGVDFAEHIAMLRSIGVDAVEIRLPAQLAHIDALIIPGGESTTITRLNHPVLPLCVLRAFGVNPASTSLHVLCAAVVNPQSGERMPPVSAGPMRGTYMRADYSP